MREEFLGRRGHGKEGNADQALGRLNHIMSNFTRNLQQYQQCGKLPIVKTALLIAVRLASWPWFQRPGFVDVEMRWC